MTIPSSIDVYRRDWHVKTEVKVKTRPNYDEMLGGESACFAHLLCATCGAVLEGSHEQSCDVDDQQCVDADERIDVSGETTR
jgi:hypothetical protein